ncbi:expressed unknown protein [Ectocarpus siliculosus]|uniref:PHD-type domain-containing protein n=1 Tax=Ectocarpus siliculosus TaxID=2880 RepID=D8LQA3_ECTSI|nr:expressed unknown protein [Ectocarpus siliculosus]|eukprot:CBN77483.1 expressed unknown protein [Ectocarpus siliculosus]
MAGNGYGNDRGGYVYDEDDDDGDYSAQQHGHGSRNFADRGYSSYDGRYDINNAYQTTRYDPSSPRGLGGPHDRGVYAPPTATIINNNRGVGSSQYPSRRGGPPGATRYPNPSTAYDNFSYPPSPRPPPSPRQPQGFGGVAGQLLNAAGQLSPSNKRASGGRAVFDDEVTIGPAAAGGEKSAARLKSTSASGGSAAASRFGLYAPSGGGSGEIPGAGSSRGDDGDGGGNARFRDRGRSQIAKAPTNPRYQERTRNSFEERDQQMREQKHQQRAPHQRKASPPPPQQPPPPCARAPATAAVATAQEQHSGGRTPSASVGGGKRSRSRSRSSSPRPPATPADPPPPPPPPPPPNQTPPAGARQIATACSTSAAARSTPASSSAAAAAAPPAAPSRPPLSWITIERAGKRRLGVPAEERRTKLGGENETVSPFQGCPIHDCPMGSSDGISVSWMARHLESHTKVAMEKPQKELYIRSSVAEILHEMCLDSEVPRAQRKFERRKMSRALLDTPRAGIGHLAGMIETVVTGDNKSPHVRRCAHDLAVGGCEGITREGTIVRCDKCMAWYHVSCGQMVRGDGISSEEAREETLCRTCARIAIGAPQGKDPTATLQKQLSLVREKRTKMLEFLEEDVETGAPCGVFDLPLNIRDVSTAGGVGPKDGNANGPDAGGNSNGGNGGVDKRDNRPPCAAASCGRESRQDSKFCCDACGVLHAEAFLAKAIRHHVEESAGIDRGRRLRETRELKTRKQQVGLAMKKVEFPRVPGFKTERETALHALVVRKCRLWQRLIEIGAYWEKVSGSRVGVLAATRTAAQTSSRKATAAAAASVTASGAVDPALSRSAPERLAGGRDRGGVIASASSSGGVQVELDVGGGSIAAAAKKNTAAASAGQQEAEVSGAGKEVVGVATAAAAAAATATAGTEGQGASNGCVGWEGGGAKKRAREDGDGPPQQAAKSLKQTSNGEAASGIDVGGGGAAITEPPSAAVAMGAQSKGKGKAALDPQAAESPTAAMEVSSADPEAEIDTGLEVPDTMAEIAGQAWTYGSFGKERVLWYCPPGGGEADRCTSSEQLQAYLRERYGNGRVPGQFTFSGKDAPPQWERVDARRPDNGSLIAKDKDKAAVPPPPSGGVQNFMCVYCGEETGPWVSEHLERCYRKTTAMRNERLKHATLRPLRDNHFLQGGSRLGAASVTEPVSVPPSAALDSPAAIGRQLLSRRIAYANFDSLPDPSRFQLHHDLKGWRESPSRLDFLYKELVRQRNAAIYELQALDREEAELEVHLRHDWMKDDLRSIPRMRINYL